MSDHYRSDLQPDLPDGRDGVVGRGDWGDDDRPLEPWLHELASSYHSPPPAPREEMWQRIQAARSVRPLRPVRRWPVALRVGAPAALAAALLLAVGLEGVGRWRGAAVDPGAASGVDAGAPSPDRAVPATSLERTPASGDAGIVREGSDGRPGEASSGGPGRVEGALEGSTTSRRPAGDRIAGRRDVGIGTGGTVHRAGNGRDRHVAPPVAGGDPWRASDAPATPTAVNVAFRLELAEHLGQAEALLTSVRAIPPDSAVDPPLQGWARELLTTTRLFQDSPAARAPGTGMLLGELETVLVQLVQLPALPTGRLVEERQLIDRSLERTDLMTQLRAAAPAGLAVAARSGE